MSMEKSVDTELLLKYISGSANPKEREKVLEWIESSQENGKTYSQLKNYWVLERYKTFNQDISGQGRSNNRATSRNFIKYMLPVAAAIVIILSFAGIIYFLTDKTAPVPAQKMASFEYIVNSGVKGVVDLPDGSKVWLNSSSSLKCPQKFDSLQRVVELDGEGYFEVLPNKDWPMYVKTYKGYGIKVTGTTFNLSSYSNENKLVVTLISGTISVVHEKNKNEIKLNPDEQITITGAESPRLVKKANIEYNTGWKKGYLLFDNTPMDEVIRKMERWYGVDFIIKDSSILEYRFTANFRSESISQVLEILKLSSNIKYEIDKTRITLKDI